MSKEAMKLALEALEVINSSDNDRDFLHSDECEALWFAIDALREALAEQPAQQQEPVISTEHGPWIPSTHPGEEGESYCKRCLLRDKFLGSRQCDPHIVEQPAQQQKKAPPEQWRERWYGSLAEKGWWICCGREHIAHLGTEVSSDEVRKIVDAHNRYKTAAQQQEPVYFCDYGYEGWGKVDAAMAAANIADGMTVEAYYTSPPAQRKPLTDSEIIEMRKMLKPAAGQLFNSLQFARAIEAAHGIKGEA